MIFKFLKQVFTVLIVCASFHFSYGQYTPIPQDSAVRIGILSNGLTYYISKNNIPKHRVELRLVVNAGSVQEDDNQLGLAHFCEHMCFRGTSHFPKYKLIHYLQSTGVNFGSEINGFTGFDETIYMHTLPSDSAKILDNGFQIMADWAHTVSFDTIEINKERDVLTEEWRIGRGALQRMSDKYIPVVLNGSKYAKHLPIGTKESIQGSSYEALKQYYMDWYRPDLMALIVVGDINPDTIENKIKTYFSTIPPTINPRKKEEYKIDSCKAPLISIVSDKENTNVNLNLSFKIPKKIPKTLDDFREVIVQRLFSSMLNSRLFEKTTKLNTPIIKSHVSLGDLIVRPCKALLINSVVKEDSVILGIREILTEIERVKRYGFLETELNQCKLDILKSTENSYNERYRQRSDELVQKLVNNYLTGEPIINIFYEYQFVKGILPTIKLEEVNILAGKWIKDKNRVLILQCVDKEGLFLPKEGGILAAISEIQNMKIDSYYEVKVERDLIPIGFRPYPSGVLWEKKIGTRDIIEWYLPNGVTVILKPTDFKNDEILMNAFSEGGGSLFNSDYKLSATFATSIITKSGLAQYPYSALINILSGKNVKVSPYISDIYSGFTGSTSVADLETMFQLIYLYFSEPRHDETAYKAFVQRTSELFKNALSNPLNYFYNEVNNIWYRNCSEVPNSFPVEKDWNNLSLDKVFEVYNRSFSNASNFTFIFVGSFKKEIIKPLVEMYLGSLNTKLKKETYIDKELRPAIGPIKEVIYKGNDPKSLVSLNLNCPGNWTKVNAHAVWTLSNILQRIFLEKLREKLSGVYSFNVNCQLGKEPYDNFSFSMTIPCAPDNADNLINAVYAEIERIKKEGLSAEEFQTEIQTQRRNIEIYEKDNTMWMYNLNLVLKTEKEFGRIEKPFELCETMTPELIRNLAIKYLDTSKMVCVILYPENFQKSSNKINSHN